jgi:hypothetical protein
MVEHPAAKSMIEIARTQDEEVGDGTTSVIILGKLFLSHDSWPSRLRLQFSLKVLDNFGFPETYRNCKAVTQMI